jgi:uncharacterized protein YcsI (UPF0317 family)
VTANGLRGEDIRAQARSGLLVGPTCGLAPDYLQANLVIVPEDLAFDFLRFCQRNPKPCPILDVTEPGAWEPRHVAPGADLRTDLPRYRVYRRGVLVEEPSDIASWWRDDLVAFLLGCSFSFEAAMQRAGLPVRHLEQGCNVPMYRTRLPCLPAGVFSGPLVVTMRPGEVPVFWACGVTPQAVLMEAKPDLAITHSPGCMFVTDRHAEEAGESSSFF